MKKDTQKRLDLIMRTREYAEQMNKGSVFVTDFKALRLLNELLEQMQEMLAENIKLQTELKFEKVLKKAKKGKQK